MRITLILIIGLSAVFSCTENKMSQCNYYNNSEALALINDIRKEKIKYLLVKIDDLSKLDPIDGSLSLLYYIDNQTLLVRVDPGFDPTNYSIPVAFGTIDYKAKYNQNLDIVEDLLTNREKVRVSVNFYLRTTKNEINALLQNLNLPFKAIPNYAEHVVVVEISNMGDVEEILKSNIVRDITYNKVFDQNYSTIEQGNFLKQIYCDGSVTPYGMSLSYSNLRDDTVCWKYKTCRQQKRG